MKKLSAVAICVLIVLAIAVQPIFAQGDGMQIGVKGGLNLANLAFDPGEAADAAIKFGAGGIMLYPISEVLDIQVELMYLLKGNKDDDFDATVNLAYLSVPVMGRYNLGSGDMSPYIAVGPEFGVLLSANVKFPEGEEDIKDDLKSLDLGLNVGAGVSMNSMFGEVRYSLGLSDINNTEGDDSTVKTTGIQLFVGMMF